MAPYYLLICGAGVYLLAADALRRHWQVRATSYCVVLAITLFAALRGYVGTDTYSYHVLFSQYYSGYFTDTVFFTEPLFRALMWLSSQLSESPFFFIALIAVVQGLILAKLVETSARPALFLIAYLGVFYLNFSFNVLRAGTAILLLILASRYTTGSRKTFYTLGASAVMMHYSAVVGLVFLALNRERGWFARLLVLIVIVGLSYAGLFLLLTDAHVGKLVFYAANPQPDDVRRVGLGFWTNTLLFTLLYAVTAKSFGPSSTFARLALFIAWLATSLAAIEFNFVDRVRDMFAALFLFVCLEDKLYGWRMRFRALLVIGISIVSIVGMFGVIQRSSLDPSLDDVHARSPFVPYKTLFSE